VTNFRKLGALVLLLASCLTPTMACIVAAPMTGEERACCRMMKNQCGQKGMPASHGCCQKIPASIYDNAVNTKVVVFHPVVVPVTWFPVLQFGNSTSLSVRGRFEPPSYSPLKFPPSTITVLRI
jgi:hypothetical protein